jgi:alpha-tubulin suppressor-like RCC1 family protein
MGYEVPAEGHLEDIYVTNDWLVERYAGDRLWLCGVNTYGRLGDNTTTTRSSLVQTVAGGTNWKFVGAGNNNVSCAIKTDGTLWMWGRNLLGLLGDNTTTDRSSPVQTVAGGNNWKSVKSGAIRSMAVKTDGTLWGWGSNSIGQLGDGTYTHRSSPVQVFGGGIDWVTGDFIDAVSVSYSSYGVKIDGSIWCWGGATAPVASISPVQLNWGKDWKQISCGYYCGAAIRGDGTLWIWGQNTYYQFGNGTLTTNRQYPEQTICGGNNWKQVSMGSRSAAAIKTDGTLWTWGNNTSGALADGTVVDRGSPVQTVCGGNNWKRCSTLGWHSCAVKTDGTLWVWGANASAQLGDNTVVPKSSPVQTAAGGNNWKYAQCCYNGISAITINNFNTIGAN